MSGGRRGQGCIREHIGHTVRPLGLQAATGNNSEYSCSGTAPILSQACFLGLFSTRESVEVLWKIGPPKTEESADFILGGGFEKGGKKKEINVKVKCARCNKKRKMENHEAEG
jgi:hypothetical protein